VEARAADERRAAARGTVGPLPLALAAVLILVGAQARDVEAVAIGVGVIAGTALVGWRHGLVGRLLVTALVVDTLVWMAPAAYSNVTHRDALLATARSASLAVLALGSLGAIATRRRRIAPRVAIGGAAVVILAIVGLSRIPAVGEHITARPGDIVVSIRTNEFSREELAADAGTLGITVTNHDVFWHTLTIDELDLDLRIPNGGTRRVQLDVDPGTYRFVCAIPGHEQAGMVGTLVVR
jgi:plastocyanin